jgi:hypothetical protein
VEWGNNDSLRGDYLWTSGNVAEAIPDVMTPCAWSAIQWSMADALGPRLVAGHPYCGTIGGRFYLNLSTALSVARRFHTTTLFRELTDRGVGPVPDGLAVPLVELPFWRSLRDVGLREVAVNVGSIVRRRSTRRTMQDLPRHCAEILDQITKAETPGDLTRLWHSEVEPLFATCCALMRHARPEALRQAICHRLLRHSIGEDLANAVTTSSADGDHLASLDLLLGLEQLADGVIDRQTFAVSFGHRGPHEYELSRPRPGEDPAWVDQQLARLASSGQSTRRLLAARAEQRDQAWKHVAGHGRLVQLRARLLARAWTGAARRRETLRSASVRGLWVLRSFVRRAGEITGAGDDLWFLSLDETLGLLDVTIVGSSVWTSDGRCSSATPTCRATPPSCAAPSTPRPGPKPKPPATSSTMPSTAATAPSQGGRAPTASSTATPACSSTSTTPTRSNPERSSSRR